MGDLVHHLRHSCAHGGTGHKPVDISDKIVSDPADVAKALSALLSCSICDRTFKHPQRMKEHQWIIHLLKRAERPKFPCPVCRWEFGSIQDRNKHRRRLHQGNAGVPCPTCGKEYASSGNLKMHQDIHHPKEGEERPNFPCPDCPAAFALKDSLKKHQQIVHPAEGQERKYICSICGKETRTPGNLKQHQDLVHPAEGFPCADCPAIYDNKADLKRHRAADHAPPGAKRFPCPVCGIGFRSPGHMRRHRDDVCRPGGRVVHTCNICERPYLSATALRRHKNYKHPGWE